MAVIPAARLARLRGWPGVLAWTLWALVMLGLAVVAWLDQLLREAGRPDLLGLTPSNIPPVVGAVSVATVGAVLAGRRPRHPAGWVLLALGLSLSAAGAAMASTNYGVAHPGAAPAAGLVALVHARHHRHGDDLQRPGAAAHPDRGAAVAPLALVGKGHGGHAGRLAAGRDADAQAR